MAGPFQVVRATPYGAQITFVNEVVADGASIEGFFDIAIDITDPNALAPGVVVSRPAVGPYLDACVFSDQIGELDVRVGIDAGILTRSILAAPIPVPANTMVPITMLRIPGRFGGARFTNTSGVEAEVDFGIFIRSN